MKRACVVLAFLGLAVLVSRDAHAELKLTTALSAPVGGKSTCWPAGSRGKAT